MNSFRDYLYYLLPSPLKILGKKLNQWWTLCRVLGHHYDEMKETILNARENSMILTCSVELLPVFGQEREMPRLDGEDIERYRLRLTAKCQIATLSGTNEGILALMKSLGYPDIRIEPLHLTEPERWAEAIVWINSDSLVIPNRDIIRQQLNEVKPASALLTLDHEQVTEAPIYVGMVIQNYEIVDMCEV